MKRLLIICALLQSTPAHAMQFLNYARQAGARLRTQISGKLRNSTTSLVQSHAQARSHGSRFSPCFAPVFAEATTGSRKATACPPKLSTSAGGKSRSSHARFSTLNSYRSFVPRLTAAQATRDKTIPAQPFDHEDIKHHSPKWGIDALICDSSESGKKALIKYLQQPHTIEDQEHIINRLLNHKEKIELTPELFEALLKFSEPLVSHFAQEYAQALPTRLNVLLESLQVLKILSYQCSHEHIGKILSLFLLSYDKPLPALAFKIYWKLPRSSDRKFLCDYVQKFMHNPALLTHPESAELITQKTADTFGQALLAYDKLLPALASRTYWKLPGSSARKFIGDYVQKFIHDPALFTHPESAELVTQDTVDFFKKPVLEHKDPLPGLAEKVHEHLYMGAQHFMNNYEEKFKEALKKSQSFDQLFSAAPRQLFCKYVRQLPAPCGQTDSHLQHNCSYVAENTLQYARQMTRLVGQAYAQEKREAEEGRICFYHGQAWNLQLLAEMYRRLHNINHPHNMAGTDFTFLRFQLPPEKLNPRSDVLWMNLALFGNSSSGSCSIKYIANNTSELPPNLTLENIFRQFGHQDHFKKYQSDFEILECMHKTASRLGNLLLISVHPEQAQKLNIKPVAPSTGTIRPVTIFSLPVNIFGKEITDIKTIVETYRHSPKRMAYMDTTACTLPITKEVLNPHNGIRIYSINNADPKKYAQVTKLQDSLIARLQLEQAKTRHYKTKPREITHV